MSISAEAVVSYHTSEGEFKDELIPVSGLQEIRPRSRLFARTVVATHGREIPVVSNLYVDAAGKITVENRLPVEVPIAADDKKPGVPWTEAMETALRAIPVLARLIEALSSRSE